MQYQRTADDWDDEDLGREAGDRGPGREPGRGWDRDRGTDRGRLGLVLAVVALILAVIAVALATSALAQRECAPRGASGVCGTETDIGPRV